ncbi:hypothetical protein GW750_00975 [bacterium]|nr:hypothetical protein [bacterium]
MYIKIQIKKSDTYERKDKDLYVTIDVTLFDLVLGGEVKVPHPD